jgi:hypothetical protein
MNKTATLRSLLLVFLICLMASLSRSASIPVTRMVDVDGSLPSTRLVDWQTGFEQFRASVMNGKAGQLVGVFAPQVFAYPVVQQPEGYPAFVSTDPGVVTQFGSPSGYGTVGLLAHNNLAGANFYKLQPGETFFLIYGDGRAAPYLVDKIHEFQALSPEDPFSNFLDLDTPGPELSSSQVFTQIYTGSEQVVFQTCLERDGNPSWGRTFISATPRDFTSMLSIPTYQSVFDN